mgnify:CR=1 FL=1
MIYGGENDIIQNFGGPEILNRERCSILSPCIMVNKTFTAIFHSTINSRKSKLITFHDSIYPFLKETFKGCAI